MLEKEVEQAVCDYAKKFSFIPYKFTSPMHRSVPDRLFLGPNGVSFFIEFKAPGNTVTEKQEREIRRILELGHRCYVINDIEEGKRVILFEVTGDATWLSKESRGLLPESPADLPVAGHGPWEDGYIPH